MIKTKTKSYKVKFKKDIRPHFYSRLVASNFDTNSLSLKFYSSSSDALPF